MVEKIFDRDLFNEGIPRDDQDDILIYENEEKL